MIFFLEKYIAETTKDHNNASSILDKYQKLFWGKTSISFSEENALIQFILISKMTEPWSLELFLVTEKEYYGYMKMVIITNIILHPREFNALFVKITIRKNTSTASYYVRPIFFLKHVNTYTE